MLDQMTSKIQTLRAQYQMNRINRQLPLDVIHTAPSGKQSPFTLLKIEFDATSYDEETGELGVFWCEGIITFDNGATMSLCPPASALSAAQ